MSIEHVQAVYKLRPDVVTPPQRAVLLCLAWHVVDDDHPAFPSIQTICDETSFSERTVQEALLKLHNKELIVQCGKRHKTFLYRVDLTKLAELRRPTRVPHQHQESARPADSNPRESARPADSEIESAAPAPESAAPARESAAPAPNRDLIDVFDRNRKSSGAIPDGLVKIAHQAFTVLGSEAVSRKLSQPEPRTRRKGQQNAGCREKRGTGPEGRGGTDLFRKTCDHAGSRPDS